MAQVMTNEDLPRAAAMLARAFRDNPAMLGLLKGDAAEARERTLRGVMLGFTRSVQRDGVVEVVKEGDSIAAASLVFPPGRFPPSIIGQLITTWGVLSSRLGRAHRFALADREMRRKHIHEPHWFLWVLGVEPERQGRGLGSRLLRSLSKKADAERMPCYLETDRQTSVRIYQNHGFQVLSDEVLRGVDTQMWFMQRPGAGAP
jgi:ribosomal protein S18 acetylase RimI-like enzyme